MNLLKPLSYLLVRYRYPSSTPEEVANDLGLSCSNLLSFQEFIGYLTNPPHCPSKLCRFMPRDQAEEAFRFAIHKEKFTQNTLFSYYFKGGWVEFILQFDDQSRLRRLYMRHRELKQKHEISISH